MATQELDACLRGYVGGGGKVRWDGGTSWNVTLAGRPSNPLPDTLLHNYKTRGFEVFVMDAQVFVTTHTADEFTGAVADGFARFVERYWQGEWVKQ